jgi:Rrf2 family protein
VIALTRKTDYALIALANLARNGESSLSASTLSRKLGVPVRTLTNILFRLKHHGIVASTRGILGGYSLAKAPQLITLAELIEAVEGPVRLTLCCNESAEPDERECNLEDSCQIKEPIRRLHAELRAFLQQVTLHDIACNTVPGGAGRACSSHAENGASNGRATPCTSTGVAITVSSCAVEGNGSRSHAVSNGLNAGAAVDPAASARVDGRDAGDS